MSPPWRSGKSVSLLVWRSAVWILTPATLEKVVYQDEKEDWEASFLASWAGQWYIQYDLIRTIFIKNIRLGKFAHLFLVQQSLKMHGLEKCGPQRYTVFNWILRSWFTGRLRSQLSCKLSWAMMHSVWFYKDHLYQKSLDLVELKLDNLQWNTLVHWDKQLIDQSSDVPSIIFS